MERSSSIHVYEEIESEVGDPTPGSATRPTGVVARLRQLARSRSERQLVRVATAELRS